MSTFESDEAIFVVSERCCVRRQLWYYMCISVEVDRGLRIKRRRVGEYKTEMGYDTEDGRSNKCQCTY